MNAGTVSRLKMSMNLLSIVSIICLCLLSLAGCQSGQAVVRNEKYQGAELSSRKILIVPLCLDAITVRNKDDIEDDFEDDKRRPEVIVQDSMYRKMVYHASRYLLAGKVSRLELPFDLYQNQSNPEDFRLIELRIPNLDKDTLHSFYFPKQERFTKESLDVVITLNNILIGRNVDRSFSAPTYVSGAPIRTPGGTFSGPGFWMGGGGGSEYLGAVVQFIVWDYQADEPISYGIVEVKESILFSLTQNGWNNLFKGIIGSLFETTPFKLWKQIR